MIGVGQHSPVVRIMAIACHARRTISQHCHSLLYEVSSKGYALNSEALAPPFELIAVHGRLRLG